jgi:hypothetical protein
VTSPLIHTNCHSDRSAADWRNLLLFFASCPKTSQLPSGRRHSQNGNYVAAYTTCEHSEPKENEKLRCRMGGVQTPAELRYLFSRGGLCGTVPGRRASRSPPAFSDISVPNAFRDATVPHRSRTDGIDTVLRISALRVAVSQVRRTIWSTSRRVSELCASQMGYR